MLARKSRIGTKGLGEVFRLGVSLRTPFLSLKYQYSPTPLLCAVVVSKKIAKKAVERNRIRRAVYRALTPLRLGKSGTLVVFVQKVPSDPLTPAFTSELCAVWGKIK